MASIIRHYELPPVHQIGDTKMSALDFDHAGWLMCDGRLLDKDIYKYLYDIIGSSFGISGETHFRIPKAAGRVAAAVGSAGPGMNDWKMGDISGEEKHALTIAEMPSHNHDLINPGGVRNTIPDDAGSGGDAVLDTDDGGADWIGQSYTISYTGGGGAHNTMQPYIVVNYIIKT
jgi:microcystin-dependent protein